MKKKGNANTAPASNKGHSGAHSAKISKAKDRGVRNLLNALAGRTRAARPQATGARSNDTPSKSAPAKSPGELLYSGPNFSPPQESGQSPARRGYFVGRENFLPPLKTKQSQTKPMKKKTAKPTLAATPKPPMADVMPTPMELATLAATLRPDFNPPDALKKAMELFLEATLFVRELPASEDAMVRLYGSEARRMAWRARPLEEVRQKVLTLDPARASDEVCDFLAANGVNWTKARTVIDNIRRYGKEAAKLFPFEIDIEAELKTFRQESGEYLIPRVLLQGIVDSEKERRKVSATKGAATKRASKDNPPKTGKAQKAKKNLSK